ncbi:hypothetical protein ACFVWX_29115 [Streptomyces sp. NPDC058220]|uniref:hypothetical protein n=1 Tax=Streptomyces sp. NPDC058220 TaxID=3346387 RepID=UPI0036EDE970
MTDLQLQRAVGVAVRAILGTVPGAVAEATRVTVDRTYRQLGTESHDTWTGGPDGLADRIVTALDAACLLQSPETVHELERLRLYATAREQCDGEILAALGRVDIRGSAEAWALGMAVLAHMDGPPAPSTADERTGGMRALIAQLTARVAELEKDTPARGAGAEFTPASVRAVRTELLIALAVAGREHPTDLQLRGAFDELGETVVCEGTDEEIGHPVDSICQLARLDTAPGPSGGSALTVYRAAHDVIPVGLYTTMPAAQRHCEALLSDEHPDDSVALSFDWIGDADDLEEPWELVAQIDGGEEQATGYVVTPLRVDAAYDPEATS